MGMVFHVYLNDVPKGPVNRRLSEAKKKTDQTSVWSEKASWFHVKCQLT